MAGTALAEEDRGGFSDSDEPAQQLTAAGDDDSGEDPLDAFMATLAEAPAAAPSRAGLAKDEDDEAGDFAPAAKRFRSTCAGDSDDEVYATAAAQEGGSLEAADREPNDGEPLPDVDHDAICYEEIASELYTVAPELSRLTAEDVAQRRAAANVRAGGRELPTPVERFGQCSALPAACLVHLRQRGFASPTAVQASALPAALSGRDLLAISDTGSGKTLAFLLPALAHAAAQRPVCAGEGPIALVLAPTRELGQQIHSEASRLGAAFGLSAAALLGGHERHRQVQQLRGAALAVATPGRAIDLARGAKAALRLTRCSFLVLDEADRLLALGFEQAVRSLCRAVRPDAQTLLFSATLGPRVRQLASSLLEDAVRLTVGGGGASSDVRQAFVLLRDAADRLAWLLQEAPRMVDEGQVLIFASRAATVDSLVLQLRQGGTRAAALHGEMDQHARSEALKAFRSGATHALVATDLAARGLDVPQLHTVLNFEPARDAETHAHRCGRTGRAGDKGGVAVTLLSPQDAASAAMLARQLEDACLPVPADLASLAAAGMRQRKRRRGAPAKSGGLGLGFAGEASAGASGRFVAGSEGTLAFQTAPEIVAPRAGWASAQQPPPPPPPLHLQSSAPLPPPPPRAPPQPPVMPQQAWQAPPPPPLVRRPAGESYHAMPPPASLNAAPQRFAPPSFAGIQAAPAAAPVAAITPQQAAARAAAQAVAARLLAARVKQLPE